jgi:hypothetical protein
MDGRLQLPMQTQSYNPSIEEASYYIAYTQGWNPIWISEMIIGKKYMCVSALPDVKHNTRCDRVKLGQSQGKFSTFQAVLKLKLFERKSKCGYTLLTLLIFELEFYAVFIYIFFPSWVLVWPKHTIR